MIDMFKWRKSSYSGQGNTCVEVSGNVPGVVAVRDSKDPGGHRLIFTATEWRLFTARVRAGDLDLR